MPRTHVRTCTRETHITRPPTSHRNRELPEIFLALASTMVFSVMDGPKNVMQLRLRPAQDEKPIFCHDFFIEVGADHIYDDTGFCHNYRHRSVICMTEFFFVRPKMSRMCLFFVVLHGNISRNGYGNAIIGRYGGCFEEGIRWVYDTD